MSITGSSLKNLRLKRRLTQKRLAELARVSQAHIAKIERGKVDPRLSTVNRILQILQAGEGKKGRDIMTKGVIFAKPNQSVLTASEVMVKNAVSQLPVSDGSKIIGTITEESIVRNLRSNLADEKVGNVMDSPLPTVAEETNIETIRAVLEKSPGVLVKKAKDIVGIITRSDLLRTIG